MHSKRLHFEKLHNIRDLGGMHTADGRTIVPNKLIRCGHLARLPEADIARLSDLIDTVVDLRTEEEQKENPDIIIDGVTYHHLPLIDNLAPGVTREEKSVKELVRGFLLKPAEAKEYICGKYLNFTEGYTLRQYAKFIRILLEDHKKAVLWHCTAGKDRAGVASVIIEEILGVPRDVIIEDYMRTNDYLAADIVFLTGMVKKEAGVEDDIADESLKYLFGADRSYIETFYGDVDRKFGSIENYIHEGMKITAEEAEQFRNRYLTD